MGSAPRPQKNVRSTRGGAVRLKRLALGTNQRMLPHMRVKRRVREREMGTFENFERQNRLSLIEI